jgi:hypothetical protein
MKKQYSNKVWTCEKCGETYPTRDKFLKHLCEADLD